MVDFSNDLPACLPHTLRSRYFIIFHVNCIFVEQNLSVSHSKIDNLTFVYQIIIFFSDYISNKSPKRLSYDEYWGAAKRFVAKFWLWHAKVWHGFEVHGFENIPKTGPAMIICYHGAIPIDCYYLLYKVYVDLKRSLNVVVDRFLFKIPGWSVIAEGLQGSTGSQESCTKILKEGNLLIICPGGVYEAQFGDSYYEVLWRKRTGFAKVAIEAKVPIIPMITENIREGYMLPSTGEKIYRKFYDLWKLPLRPVYGSFPVKLRSYLGKPIPYDPTLTPEELQQKVARAIEDLFAKNQRIPGNLSEALKDRFREKQPIDVAENLKNQRRYVLGKQT